METVTVLSKSVSPMQVALGLDIYHDSQFAEVELGNVRYQLQRMRQ